jgi:hypothetical protein
LASDGPPARSPNRKTEGLRMIYEELLPELELLNWERTEPMRAGT